MHGRTVQWLACTLAAAVVFGACGLAGAQDAILMDPGYAMATSEIRASATNKLVSTSGYTGALESRVAALETALQDEAEGNGWEDVSAEKWSHKAGGLVQFDAGMFAHQDGGSELVLGNLQNYLEARRLRLFVQGQGYGVYDYKVELDFDDARNNMKDVYVGIHEIPYLGYVRAGHFKEPFSLEELTHETFLTFLERSLPNQALVRGRSVGICAYNHTDDEQFTIASGAFVDIDEEEKETLNPFGFHDDELGMDLATRVTWNPWYTAEGRGVLHVGGGHNFQDHRGRAIYASNPEINELNNQFGPVSALASGLLFNDWVNVFNAESALVYGPFSLQGEAFYANTTGEAGQEDSDFYGAYVYASYFLTGEHRPYCRKRAKFGRVVPYTNFFVVRTADGSVQSGLGAWELAARWSWVEIRDGIDVANTVQLAGKLNDVTLGVNWYLNPYTRIMFNYIHAWHDWAGPNSGQVLLGDTSGETDILACRLQFDF
jgi:phosphate-selective porin OprO/OprP